MTAKSTENSEAPASDTIIEAFAWCPSCTVELHELEDGYRVVVRGYPRLYTRRFDDGLKARLWFESYRVLQWHRDPTNGNLYAEASEGVFRIVYVPPKKQGAPGAYAAVLDDKPLANPQVDRKSAKAIAQTVHDQITRGEKPTTAPARRRPKATAAA